MNLRSLFAASSLLLATSACAGPVAPLTLQDEVEGVERRMPAEWEAQEAVWLQWPQAWEPVGTDDAFVAIIEVITDYEPVHLLVADEDERAHALAALAGVDPARLELHVTAINSSWMRDNGPRYVEVDGQLVVQNWEFDGWGEYWGPASDYVDDNRVPDFVGELLGLPVEQVSMVHERGDLEVNGLDTAMVNWSVVSHRNPGQSQAELEAMFTKALGVSSVIWLEGFDPDDGTRGHVDGMARFVAEDRVLVGDDGSALMDEVAGQIAAQRPDLTIERLTSPHASLFMNFLVGNGFVLVATSGDLDEDAIAEQVLADSFPGRDIRFTNVDALWANGGGIHCVTNDQPR